MNPEVVERLFAKWAAYTAGDDPIETHKRIMEHIVVNAVSRGPVSVKEAPYPSTDLVDRYYIACTRSGRYTVVNAGHVVDVVVWIPELPGLRFRELEPSCRDRLQYMIEMWLQDESRLGNKPVSACLVCETYGVIYAHNSTHEEIRHMLGWRTKVDPNRYTQYTIRTVLQLYHKRIFPKQSIREDAVAASKCLDFGNPYPSRQMRTFAIRIARSCAFVDEGVFVVNTSRLCKLYPGVARHINGETDDWSVDLEALTRKMLSSVV